MTKSAKFYLPIGRCHIEAQIAHSKKTFSAFVELHEPAIKKDKGGDPNRFIPKYPIFFTKPPTAVIGPNELIKNHKKITGSSGL